MDSFLKQKTFAILALFFLGRNQDLLFNRKAESVYHIPCLNKYG